jgi:ComF family protein
MVYRLPAILLRLLFPGQCRLCGIATRNALQLCPDCRHELPWLETACHRCGQPLPARQEDTTCGRCQHQPPAFDITRALFHYRPPIDYLVKRLKFSDELAIGRLFACLLAEQLAARQTRMPELLLPVPLHRTRRRERGFNQATELARHLGRELGIPVNQRLCRRHRHTQPQSLLPIAARRKNLRRAFSISGKLPATHVAIVDDVMTTGHTAGELARVLKQAGADIVEVWVIARAGS